MQKSDAEKKLAFILQMTKHGLQHYDSGGTVQGSTSPGVAAPVSNVVSTGLSPATGVLSGVSQALTTQNNFQAQGPTSLATVGGQQAGLAAQLQQEAAGGGPNPAQIQEQQNANAIAHKAAAANAQNRALNPGLAARMSGNQAVEAEQNAASNAAAQQAQQQITSQQQLAGLTGQEQQGALNAQGINAQTAQANANAVNSTEGGILNGIGGLLGLYTGGEVEKYADGGFSVLNFSSLDSGSAAIPSFGFVAPSAAVGSGWGQNGDDEQSQIAAGNAQLEAAPEGEVDLNMYGGNNTNAKAHGGMIHMMPEHMKKMAMLYHGGKLFKENKKTEKVPAQDRFAKGGKVPALVSPGEGYQKPADAKAVADGKVNPMKVAEKIPGKAKVKGDSEKNDVVAKKLDEGGFVIPRSVMNSDDPAKEAARMVAEHLRGSKAKKSPEKEEFMAALSRSIKGRKAA